MKVAEINDGKYRLSDDKGQWKSVDLLTGNRSLAVSSYQLKQRSLFFLVLDLTGVGPRREATSRLTPKGSSRASPRRERGSLLGSLTGNLQINVAT